MAALVEGVGKVVAGGGMGDGREENKAPARAPGVPWGQRWPHGTWEFLVGFEGWMINSVIFMWYNYPLPFRARQDHQIEAPF